MKCRCVLVLTLLIGLFLAPPVTAQQAGSDDPAHNLAAFMPLDLPAANSYRAGSGAPGEDYWQQRADYRIQVTLDPATHRITGTETITYTNNSPHALEHLWLQLDQNLFAPGSRGARLQPPDSRWRGAFEDGGYTISRVELVRDGRREQASYVIDDTRMQIVLTEPLPPGGSSIDIEIDFAFTIPQYGADRMGYLEVDKGIVYELAQWYPRMYVYDDVSGWNHLPYLGQGEFYLEFGTFDVDITVPRDFIVVATGSLENPAEVLTAEQLARLEQARRSSETVTIVGRDEVGKPGTRPEGSDMLTWRFHAENVRDFAWAASQAFIWDAASWNDVLVMSVYPEEGVGTEDEPGWEHSTQYVRHSISHYSERWFPYPYPVAVNVAGVVGGMEYPAIVFCSVNARGAALFGVTDHEFGHIWFPMIVGSDERRYAWMDEGFNTFLNYYSNLEFYEGGNAWTDRVEAEYVAGRMQEPLADQPIFTYPDRIRRQGLGFLAYRKPAAGLVILREYVLGPERFDRAFREYIQRWAYKHPQPADFFRTVENVSGEDLDWFWRGWFTGTDVLDQAVTHVTREGDRTFVELATLTDLIMPVEVELQYADGETERRRVPVEAFFTTDVHTLSLDRADLVGVAVDPDGMLPDTDRSNNSWKASELSSPNSDGR